MMLERDAHSNGAKTVTLENKPVDTGPILTAFGGSMARKEAERNTVMAEHLMETTVRTALWQQFSAAIAMLENALLACSETLWQEHLWIDVESADAPNVEHWDTRSVEKPLPIWLLPSTACKLEGGKRGSR